MGRKSGRKFMPELATAERLRAAFDADDSLLFESEPLGVNVLDNAGGEHVVSVD